jgi:hypothetical protein
MSEVIQAGTIQRRKRFLEMTPARKKLVVEIVSALFILLFLYTAISKTYEIGKTQAAIYHIPFFEKFSLETAWAIVAAEYLVSALLFFPFTRRIGLYSSLILMLVFTAYISLMMAFSPELPCSCGGVIQQMTWTQHLIFNVLFTGLAFLANRFDRDLRKARI